MKLKNFMFATMIACAFASCSEDDVIDNGTGPVTKGDASLTIKINTDATKALGDGDETINELSVFLYKITPRTDGVADADTLLAAKQYTNAYNANGQIVFENLTANDKYLCVGFANLGNVTEAMAAGTAPLGLTTDPLRAATNIPMHGVSSPVVIKAVGNTEATIDLTRDLAKVELTAVTLDMNYEVNGTRFGDYKDGVAKFKFLSASINSSAKAVNYTYAPNNITTFTDPTAFVGGLTGWSWAISTNPVKTLGNAGGTVGYLINGGAESVVASQAIGTPKPEATEVEKADYAAQTVAKPTVVFYVLPNTTADKTTLTLKGQMQLINAATASQSNINNTVDGYYNIEIGKDATADQGFSYTAGSGVHANDYFKIQAIVVGTGSGIAGDQPKLIVKTRVAAWNAISQTTPVK